MYIYKPLLNNPGLEPTMYRRGNPRTQRKNKISLGEQKKKIQAVGTVNSIDLYMCVYGVCRSSEPEKTREGVSPWCSFIPW